jgi:enoyl-[acyl-carrier protein] reductase I
MDALSEHWDKLNVLIHSIAFAPKDDLDGRVTDVSLAGFLTAMERAAACSR